MRKTTQTVVLELPVTAAEARLRLRIDSVDEATDALVDNELEAIIGAATALAESKLKKAVASARYVLRDSDGLPAGAGCIKLSWPDVNAIESFTYVDADEEEQTITASGYRLIGDEFLHPPLEDTWPTGVTTDMEITYTAGWGVSAPDDIKQYVLLHVGHFYRNRESVNVGNLVTPLPYAEALLNRHRIIEV